MEAKTKEIRVFDVKECEYLKRKNAQKACDELNKELEYINRNLNGNCIYEWLVKRNKHEPIIKIKNKWIISDDKVKKQVLEGCLWAEDKANKEGFELIFKNKEEII